MRGFRPAASSLIERILFDEDTDTLTVWFRRSGKYVYSGVPRALFDALAKASSVGTVFNQMIRGRFACRPDPPRRFRPE